MEQCKLQLAELDRQTEKLNQDFAEKTQAAGMLEASLRKVEQTLDSAQRLLQQLGGENERWHTQVDLLQRELALVPIKSLLSSAFITYLGGENESSREAYLQQWRGALRLEDFNIRSFLATEA